MATEPTAAKEKPQTAKSPNRLRELIKLVVDTANAKGWRAQLIASDEKNSKYATVGVSRFTPDTTDSVSGTFEITCDEKIKITYHKTSFYNWGLGDLYDAISNEFWKLPWIDKKLTEEKARPKELERTDDVALVERFLRRFHSSARQLKHRHADRAPFLIQDEFDVQDLLHAILRGLFDDVRAEEHTPSYAGGASRMDFLLKAEQIVIEVKVATPSLRDKQIGEQLIIDIQRYRSHPDCKRLICFVYDPSGNVRNPNGLEADLSRPHDGLAVKVIVVSL